GVGEPSRVSGRVMHIITRPLTPQVPKSGSRGSARQGSTMKTRRLGRTGLKVSEVCLGTMTFAHQCDEKTSFQIMEKASERGVYFFDTADIYPVPPSPETAGGTEVIVGKWLKGKRDRFVLATKCRMRVGTGAN